MDTVMGPEIKLFASPTDLFQFAAEDFKQRAIMAVEDKGVFTVVLSGGNTPKSFFITLTSSAYTRENIPWAHIQFFFGDERYVPADNKASNYHTAYEYLFSKVPIPAKNIYRMPTEWLGPREVAKQYGESLRKVLHCDEYTIPQFDLCYLGLGDNAHTASLMPESEIVVRYSEQPPLDKDDKLVEALFVPALNQHRLTFTPRLINQSAAIIFLVTGANKAEAVWEVLQGPADKIHYPAQLIHSLSGKTIWYVDKAAAHKISVPTQRGQ